MNLFLSRYSPTFASRASHVLIAVLGALAVGCGVETSQLSTPSSSGNTLVTVLSSSTANNKLQDFFITLNSVTLTSNTGKTVTLFATPEHIEFMHVNGTTEPITTVSVPHGVYTSATISVGSAEFICENLDPINGNITSGEFGNEQISSPSVTVNLPEPITITGTKMEISLNLLVSQSATWTTCNANATAPYSITPTFNVTPITYAAQAANNTNKEVFGLRGLISSVNANGTSFNVTSANVPGWEVDPSGPGWKIISSSSTVYQRINEFSEIVPGMPVDMDAIIQEDGSLLATRIAVYDTDTTTLSISSGPLLSVAASQLILTASDAYAQGYLPGSLGAAPFGFDKAIFQISGQLSNVQTLPFAASFSAANMVAGQNLFISSHAQNTPTSIPAATITLIPQTIDGTISEISSSGGFTTYTVSLASYDLFSDLAVQTGQTTLLDPGSVVVYVDSSTQLLNTSALAVGNVLRFNGLVFNDNGTLRMDCVQVNDGVAE